MPVVYFQVYSIDKWDVFRVEGYGHFSVPTAVGSHTVVAESWRPCGSKGEAQARFFVGGGPGLDDTQYPRGLKLSRDPTDDGAKKPVLSKFGFRTQSSGSVLFRAHVVKQRKVVAGIDDPFGELELAESGAASLLVGGGGGGAVAVGLDGPASGFGAAAAELSRNTRAVLAAFERAKARSNKIRKSSQRLLTI
jgi:hypothetical protein